MDHILFEKKTIIINGGPTIASEPKPVQVTGREQMEQYIIDFLARTPGHALLECDTIVVRQYCTDRHQIETRLWCYTSNLFTIYARRVMDKQMQVFFRIFEGKEVIFTDGTVAKAKEISYIVTQKKDIDKVINRWRGRHDGVFTSDGDKIMSTITTADGHMIQDYIKIYK